MDLMKLTAVQLSEKIRAGEIRVAEAVQAALDAIEEKDQTINAFITVDREGALKAAEEIQKKIDAGELTGASGRRSGGGKRQYLHERIEDHLRLKDPLQFCAHLQRGGH